ncbi:hypothetical protein QQF64_019746 [Cirrhinus molitorella]|uniref:AIG1-type G domain-containing protein n=1 Tax=Cirrhinus molitorella TaxID=172907 RepID=A0ABR3LHW8_9TELE
MFRGTINKPQNERRRKREEKINGRQISVIELSALTRLSKEEVMRETFHCLSLCDPGVHVFILVTPVSPLTNKERAEMEKIKRIFNSNEHFMVLFITDNTVDRSVSDFVASTESQSAVSLYGRWCSVMGLKDQRNSEKISDLFDCIESMKIEPYSLQTYMRAPEKRGRHGLQWKQRVRENEEMSKALETLLETQMEKVQNFEEMTWFQSQDLSLDSREREDELKIVLLGKTAVDKYDEDSPSDSGCLRILLFGRTGSGKSATGNTILGNSGFHSEDGSQLVTTVCQKGVGEVNGKSLAVIDTPGLFDTTLTNEQVQEEIMNCISLSAPGPHAIIIVINMGKITKEEKDTLDMIKMIFGPKAADFCIVLFTRGDNLREETIEVYVEKHDELKTLIKDCGNRFLAFNNTETQHHTQVTQLFNMIEEMKRSNQGRYFTNEMFQEAATSIEQRMEIITESERQNLMQIKELQDKYDTEINSMRKRLEEKKQKIIEERERLKNKFREQEETLRREFEEEEKSELEKRETEDLKRSEEEKQQKAEYDQRIEEMKKEREDKEREYEEKKKEMERRYDQLERERNEEWRRRKQEDEERRVEKRKKWEKMMEDLKREQEEEIRRREREEKEIIDRRKRV